VVLTKISLAKFIVFYTRLLVIFSIFCFKCKSEGPDVTMKKNGTMVTVMQNCRNCGPNSFVWRSQPMVLGRYPAGNILLSFRILMAGATVSKVLLVLKHMGISVYNARTYFVHQSKFLFPAILTYWERYRSKLVNQIKEKGEAIWCGDGRFDSAKYGAYTIFCFAVAKIVHFELVQVYFNLYLKYRYEKQPTCFPVPYKDKNLPLSGKICHYYKKL